MITAGTQCPGSQCRIPHFLTRWGTREPPAPRWPLPAFWLGSAVPAHTDSQKPSRQLQQIYLCSQFSTGLLLGPAKLLPQLELCTGREAQALIAGAALTSCWQGLKHPRPTSPGLLQTPQPGKHVVVVALSASTFPCSWCAGTVAGHRLAQREGSPAPAHTGWRGCPAIAVSHS